MTTAKSLTGSHLLPIVISALPNTKQLFQTSHLTMISQSFCRNEDKILLQSERTDKHPLLGLAFKLEVYYDRSVLFDGYEVLLLQATMFIEITSPKIIV